MQFNDTTIYQVESIDQRSSRDVAEIIESLEMLVSGSSIEWIQDNISLSFDPTAAHSGKIELDSWQVEPIMAQYDPEVRDVVLMMIEQIGKSTVWRMPLIHKMIFDPSPSWVLFESADKAEDVNKRTLYPMLNSLPQTKKLMNRNTARLDGYDFTNGAVLDFSGAGSDITSKPIKHGVGDEVDRWGTPKFTAQQVRNLKKRFRTFRKKNQGCLVLVSSPKNDGGMESAINNEFKSTDMGYLHLKCDGCGGHTMRSCDIHNLQWNTSDSGVVDNGSIVLVCPKCKHEHKEDRADHIAKHAKFIKKNPDIKKSRGFQVGALGVPRVFSWLDIAEAQLEAGSTADVQAQVDFDNSWRGLPFSPRRISGKREEKLKKRATVLPDSKDFIGMLFAADTQGEGDHWYWIVRGIDKQGNTYLIDNGRADTEAELESCWNGKYHDKRCTMGIIDCGGHYGTEIIRFVKDKPGLYAYKGDTKIRKRWKPSDNVKKLILANAIIYQSELLYYMYSAKNMQSSNWYIKSDESSDYMQQMTDMRPDNKIKNGHEYDRWTSSGNDHYFDCEKMFLVVKEMFFKALRAKKK